MIRWKNLQFVDWFLLLLFAVLMVEIGSHLVSIYRPNSFYSLEKIFYWVCYCLCVTWTLTRIIQYKALHLLYYLLGALSFGLALGGLLNFMVFRSQLLSHGWQDVHTFKGLFSPFGLKLNDWAGIGICILPFPLILAVLLRKNKGLFYFSLVAFILVFYAILISFSRGVYLSLIVFIGLLLWFIFYYKLVPRRRVLVMILVCFFGLIILSYPVSSSVYATLSLNKTVSQQRSTLGRMEILKNGVYKIRGHPWFGRGGYNFSLGDNYFVQDREDAGVSIYANNLYVQLLVEKGLVGLFVYCALFLFTLFRFLKHLRNSISKSDQLIQAILCSGFIAYLFRELFFASFFENNLVLILVGFYCSLSQAAYKNPIPVLHRFVRIGLLFGMVSIGVWIIFKKSNYLKSDQIIHSSLSDIKKTGRDALKLVEASLKLTPDVAPYHVIAGIFSLQDSISIKNLSSTYFLNDSAKIKKSVAHFDQALRLCPDNAGFHFNLACLNYILYGYQNKITGTHFQNAIQLEPNNSEFLIGYGLCSEFAHDTELATNLYKRAIRIDPEILDSEFFKNFSDRNSVSREFILTIIDTLDLLIIKSSSPILKARLAKLKLAVGDTLEAKALLLRVIAEMPDLNRPYYYLGQIEDHEGDHVSSLSYYKKSLFLNAFDYLPAFALYDYYKNHPLKTTATETSAQRYFNLAHELYLINPGQYTAKEKALYRTFQSVKNDLVFSDLPVYIRKWIDFKIIH